MTVEDAKATGRLIWCAGVKSDDLALTFAIRRSGPTLLGRSVVDVPVAQTVRPCLGSTVISGPDTIFPVTSRTKYGH